MIIVTVIAAIIGILFIGFRFYTALWRTFQVVGNPNQPWHKRYLAMDWSMWVLWFSFIVDSTFTFTASMIFRILFGIEVGVPVGVFTGLMFSTTITLAPWLRAWAISTSRPEQLRSRSS